MPRTRACRCSASATATSCWRTRSAARSATTRAGARWARCGVELHPHAADDPLFGGLPTQFPAQATHLQTVLRRRRGDGAGAAPRSDACHAFRWGESRLGRAVPSRIQRRCTCAATSRRATTRWRTKAAAHGSSRARSAPAPHGAPGAAAIHRHARALQRARITERPTRHDRRIRVFRSAAPSAGSCGAWTLGRRNPRALFGGFAAAADSRCARRRCRALVLTCWWPAAGRRMCVATCAW